MGQESSTLRPDEIKEMQEISNFTPNEIKKLYQRFRQLDKSDSGTITSDDLFHIPELAMNPLASRIISVFDVEERDEINFKQFIKTLSIFSKNAKREEKLQFAFQIYDIKGDDIIDADELFVILKALVGQNLSDRQIHHIVEQTIVDADTIDHDGGISFEEFKRIMFDSDIQSKLTIEF